ncbi:MAG: class I SAM-dependent methyltransferase [Chloroflexaceae bacterium]|nr:class I SAM-dependent methyltransferase [Chloroflexaceae bacterium]
MVPRALFRILQCPTCGSRQLYVTAAGVHCAGCANIYPISQGYLDMMPRNAQFGYRSKYVTEEQELASELDYRELAPPLLAAGVRHRAMQRMLDLQPGDIVLDNGCGSAKFAAWNAHRVALMVGNDPATLFAEAAVERVALVKADSRVLPFADDSLDKAFSIDVLEHFPREVIDAYLRETARVLRPGGQMFIFSNTRERSPIQPVIDLSRHLGQALVRAGLYDFEREARRKSDHLKALETWDEVQDTLARAGLRPVRVVFWNSLFTTLVEHVVMKLGEVVVGGNGWSRKRQPVCNEQQTAGQTGAQTVGDQSIGAREIRARQRMRKRLERRGATYYALQAVTLLMELDLWLFGWMRSGSYFVVVEKGEKIEQAGQAGADFSDE